MALGAPQAAPKPAGGPPPMAGGPSPAAGGPPPASGQPFGGSPATQATPNAGYEAAATQRLGVFIKQVQDVMGMVGASSEIGQKLLKVLNILVSMVPSGTVTPAAEKNMLEQAQMRNTQNQQVAQQLKQQRMQPPGPAAGAGGPPQGAAA